MVNLDIIDGNFGKYAVSVNGLEQAQLLQKAVEARWPHMTKNWSKIIWENYDWSERCFVFQWCGVTALYHGPVSQHLKERTILPFEDLCVMDLPEFEVGDISIASLLGV